MDTNIALNDRLADLGDESSEEHGATKAPAAPISKAPVSLLSDSMFGGWDTIPGEESVPLPTVRPPLKEVAVKEANRENVPNESAPSLFAPPPLPSVAASVTPMEDVVEENNETEGPDEKQRQEHAIFAALDVDGAIVHEHVAEEESSEGALVDEEEIQVLTKKRENKSVDLGKKRLKLAEDLTLQHLVELKAMVRKTKFHPGQEARNLDKLMLLYENFAKKVKDGMPLDKFFQQFQKLGSDKDVKNMLYEMREGRELHIVTKEEALENPVVLSIQKPPELDAFGDIFGDDVSAESSFDEEAEAMRDVGESNLSTITDKQRERTEANRLAALERRKSLLEKASQESANEGERVVQEEGEEVQGSVQHQATGVVVDEVPAIEGNVSAVAKNDDTEMEDRQAVPEVDEFGDVVGDNSQSPLASDGDDGNVVAEEQLKQVDEFGDVMDDDDDSEQKKRE